MSSKNPNLTLIHRRAMKDERLTIEAKAILSYLLAYNGTFYSDFPTQELMSEELNVTPARFRRHIEYLERYGYVTRQRVRDDWGMLGKYEYIVRQPYTTTEDEGN